MEKIRRRKLQIKSFHIKEVVAGATTSIKQNILTIEDSQNLVSEPSKHIKSIDIKLIKPEEKHIFVNSIMDFIPISAKVLGSIGQGITHTLTGVFVMLTGADELGIQVAEFGSSEGILSEQVAFDRAGTPGSRDLIIHVDVTLYPGSTKVREGIDQCHLICDKFIQDIRDTLKRLNGRECDEKHEFYDEINPSGRKVVILKQVAGQGAMYDTRVLPDEPSGFQGGRSVIDLGNLPVFLTPNEYRDGAIRAMH